MVANVVKYKGRLADTSINWLEEDLQAHIVKNLRRIETDSWTFAADMNGVAKSSMKEASKAKVLGLTEGEPDLRFYLKSSTLKWIELKKVGGRLSPSQKKRIPLLESLGFEVRVIYGASPVDAWNKVRETLIEWKML